MPAEARLKLVLDPRDRRVTGTGERAAEQYGLRLEWLEASLFAGPQGLEALDQQLQRGLSLVALSAVQFQSGLLMPVQEVVRLCHARGAEVCVDVIQAAGVVPLQLAEWDVDYAAGGAHKWLMGCEGAGYLYVSPQAARRWTHRWAGWLSHPEPVDFLMAEGQLRYNKPVRPEVQALEIGTQPHDGDLLHAVFLHSMALNGVDVVATVS